ncbi:MAG: Sec-dependent nitrous-oxide reductase [Magnetococcales bacterium]|nr:Sec-dependent nitrous-oxide reductase [Magnetococcales bacterium]
MQKRLGWKGAALSLFIGLGLISSATAGESLKDVMKRRGLNQKDLLAAAKTFVPTGKRDEFIVFSSAGQWGGVIVYGIPSMRILKYISVFQAESWQGYGYDDESKRILFGEGQRKEGPTITWGDTHHPAISETNGDYDGRWLFINDKANPRLAVIDLHDFETKQIVVNPHFKSEHGGAFVTPNTDYIIETAQYPAPFAPEYVPLEQFNEKYRGGVTYWKFDKKAGRIDKTQSFSVELPPYTQDISDFGKKASDGWSFTNSFCAERYTGGFEEGRPPFEAGCSANDTDMLHVINWKKAAQLYEAGKANMVNGMAMLSMKTMVDNQALFLIPEPKSPHGVDVTPDGKHIIVSGKLDTHVSVYSFDKIQKAIKSGNFAGKDDYGIPIIDMKDALHGQLSVGLGPLHTQMGSGDGEVYTSLYVDSMVAKWNYKTLKVLDKVPVSYNIGHLMTMHGDTVKPRGKYLVALNKLAIDRFNPVGPLHPQNHQLIDINNSKMSVIYDMPLPLGEPHLAVAIDAKLLKPHVRYRLGTDSRTGKRSPYRTRPGREKTVRTCDDNGKCTVEVFGTLIRSHINPEKIEATVGDTVKIHLTNLERAQDETHGFTVDLMNVHASVEPGKTASVTFTADREGVFPYYCTEFCSALHLEMEGYLLVKPKGAGKSYASSKKLSPAEQAKFKKSYEAKLKTIAGTNDVINSVVKAITEMGYAKDPRTKALMDDAVDQLNKIPDVEKKMKAAVEKQDWKNAADWAEMIWQYQVKTADIGLRIKMILEEKAKQ